MNIPSVSYDVVDESGYFYVFAKVGSERVGELLVDKIAVGRARLGSIEVKCDWSRRRSWRERLKKEPLRIFDTISFRNRGIATDLIERLAGWCSRNGVGEVFGSVVESDLKKTPRLLEWYERRGFIVCAPSSECLPIAIKMVVWKQDQVLREDPVSHELCGGPFSPRTCEELARNESKTLTDLP